MQDSLSPNDLKIIIEAARGLRKYDIAINNGFTVNVFTGDILRENVGITDGRIAYVGDSIVEAEHTINAEGLFIVPGFIDSHMHLESSMLTPAEFARAVVPLGTTAVVIDPHEIANVAGIEGIMEIMSATEELPLRFFFMIPPSVPACKLDSSGACISADDIASISSRSDVLGIAEAMDISAILEGDPEMLDKLAHAGGKVIDGHAPGLTGRDLQAYLAAGISSDHETTNSWEGLEKLRAGLYLMIREGSAAHDLDQLAGLVNPDTVSRCLLVTDDLLPTDMEEHGHMNYLLSRIVKHGIAPSMALRMATINAAQRFHIERMGAIAPGYAADIAIVHDLNGFQASMVISHGKLAAMDGEMVVPIRQHEFSDRLTATVHLPEITAEDLIIPAQTGMARVIEAADGQLITRQIVAKPAILAKRVVPDVGKDILKIAVIERHGISGNIGLGLVRGFGLKSGAIAGSVAHDSHNIVAVGANDADILLAIHRIGEMNGGLVVVDSGQVKAELPLPIAGLLSMKSASITAEMLRVLEQAAKNLGCLMSHPFGTLSFMCLSVIPELKLIASGLVDVNGREIVSLFIEERKDSECTAAG